MAFTASYRVWLAFRVARDQIGTYFLHLLSHEPELRNALGTKLFL